MIGNRIGGMMVGGERSAWVGLGVWVTKDRKDGRSLALLIGRMVEVGASRARARGLTWGWAVTE